MKLNKVQIGRTLSQFRALVLAEDHPAAGNFANCLGIILSFSTPAGSTYWSCAKFLGWKLRTER